MLTVLSLQIGWLRQPERKNIMEMGDIKTEISVFPQVHFLLLTHAHKFAKFYQNSIVSRGFFIQNQRRAFLTLIGGGVYETDILSLTHDPRCAWSAQKEIVSPSWQKSITWSRFWNSVTESHPRVVPSTERRMLHLGGNMPRDSPDRLSGRSEVKRYGTWHHFSPLKCWVTYWVRW